jgi:hypothetical protein
MICYEIAQIPRTLFALAPLRLGGFALEIVHRLFRPDEVSEKLGRALTNLTATPTPRWRLSTRSTSAEYFIHFSASIESGN